MSKIPKISSIYEKNLIIHYIQNKTFSANVNHEMKDIIRKKSKNFILVSNNLFVEKNGVRREFICAFEEEKRNYIIKEKHIQDHIGGVNLYARVSENFAGIGRKDCIDFVRRCLTCQRRVERPIQINLTPIITYLPRERLMVDTIDMSRFSQRNSGFKYIFTMIDAFSKFGWAYRAKDKTAETFADVLLKHFHNEGFWRILHTDNGREFVNSNVQNVLSQTNSRHVTGRPYHPQSQGQVERFNRTIKTRIHSLMIESEEWTNSISRIVFNYNSCKHRATGVKPFVLFKSTDPSSILYQQNFQNNVDYDQIFQNMFNYINKWRMEFERRNLNQNISVNDRVLLSLRYNEPRTRIFARFEPLYEEDTYLVLELIQYQIKIKNERTNTTKIVLLNAVKNIIE